MQPRAAEIDIFGADQSALVPASAVESIRRKQESASAASTRRHNKTDWKAFTDWCTQRGVSPLPADPMVVAWYLNHSSNLVDENGDYYYAPGTIAGWLGAINKLHNLAGFPKPGAHPEVSVTMEGIRRERARPIARKAPLLLADLKRVLGEIDLHSWPAGVIGQRDSTLILFGFVGAYRRSELASLQLRDVRIHPEDGLHVLLRSSKTDQDGRGVVKGLPYGANPITCAPCAFVRWVRILAAMKAGRPALLRLLHEVDTSRHVCRGPLPELAELDGRLTVFRTVMKNGAVKDAAISGNVVNDVVQRRVAAAGMNAPAYGAHSLRAGFVTQSFRAGADHHQIMRQTGHKTITTLEIYSRENDPLRHNAVTRLGL